MFFLATLSCSITLTSAFLIPPPLLSSKRAGTTTSQISYFQGSIDTSSQTCGAEVIATGSVTTGKCSPLTTPGVSITPLNTHNCNTPSTEAHPSDCDVNSSDTETTLLPARSEPMCLNTGVLDGGEYDLASAILHCGHEVSAQAPSRIRRTPSHRAAPAPSPPPWTSLPRINW